jgi:hypothetical protein
MAVRIMFMRLSAPLDIDYLTAQGVEMLHKFFGGQ